MFEKEIAALNEQHNAIMSEIDAMESIKSAEKRDWNNDEVDVLQAKIDEAEKVLTSIKDLQAKGAREEALAKHRNWMSQPKAIIRNEPASAIHSAKTDMLDRAFRNYLRRGIAAEAEYRALAQDTDSAGGYLNAPANWSSQLIKSLDDQVFIRQIATVLPPLSGSDTQGFPVLATDLEDADWTSEIKGIDEDTGLTVGKRELKPNLLTKYIKVSMKLLNISNFPVETFVQQRLAYKNAITLEKAYLTGDGDGEPLGIFTASANGIPDTRDVTSDLNYESLCEVVDSVDIKYHPRCSWVFSQSVLSQLRAWQDAADVPLFAQSVAQGVPPTLLGFPYRVSNYAPTYGVGDYALAFGDFSNYWLIDHSNFGLQRVDQLLALTNQVVFISRWMSDGAPVLSEAFARLEIPSGS